MWRKIPSPPTQAHVQGYPMTKHETNFGDRLRQRRESLGIRKQDLATSIGVSLTTIQQYENGQMPKGEFAVRLGQALSCSLDWLLAGKATTQDHDENPANNLVLVPMVEARLSAGGGSFETGMEHVRHYAFRFDFLRRKGTPASMVLLRVAGDSMQPYILHNDVVLVDQSQITPKPGHVYAVGVEDMVYLKTVDAMPGKIILSSINPDYSPIEVESCEHTEHLVRIIGRAVWLGRELI